MARCDSKYKYPDIEIIKVIKDIKLIKDDKGNIVDIEKIYTNIPLQRKSIWDKTY